MYFTHVYWFSSRDPANSQIKYLINWSFFPFYIQLANDILLIKNIITNKQYPETYLDEIQEWIENLSTKYVGLKTIHRCVQNMGFSRKKVLWLDSVHLLLVRTSVTMNEVYSLKCLLEFVSFTTFAAQYHRKGTGWNKESEISSNNQPVQSWSAIVYQWISQKMRGLFGQVPV